MALGDEIQAVQAEALQALELELEGAVEDAFTVYTKAFSQLQYLLDMCVPESQTDLSVVCRGLLHTYARRIEALQARSLHHECGEALRASARDDGPATSNNPSHWVHLATTAAQDCGPLYYDAASAGSASEGTILPPQDPRHPAAPIACVALSQGGITAGLGETNLVTRADEGGHGTGAADAARGAAKMELLRQCQREVSGTLDDVVGLESVKDELEEAFFMPLQHPHLFKGIRKPPRHFLLFGPPGTGKTLLVEKMAAEAGFTLLALSPSSIVSKWSGESEKALQLAFNVARAMAPAVVFLDEIDALGRARGDAGDDASSRRMLTELLLQMNALAGDEGVYMFAATNRMADCDLALLRRFDRRLEIPLPDAAARASFISCMLSRPEISSHLEPPELLSLAAATEGFSGSDMACLCRHAAMAPVRELFAARGRGKRRRLEARDAPAEAAGAGSGGGGSGGGSSVGGGNSGGVVAVRKLVLGDFEAALLKIRPAAMDAVRSDKL